MFHSFLVPSHTLSFGNMTLLLLVGDNHLSATLKEGLQYFRALFLSQLVTKEFLEQAECHGPHLLQNPYFATLFLKKRRDKSPRNLTIIKIQEPDTISAFK